VVRLGRLPSNIGVRETRAASLGGGSHGSEFDLGLLTAAAQIGHHDVDFALRIAPAGN
jgi:hypothetical protein